MTDTTATARDAYIKGLHALAAFLDANPDVPLPPCGTEILVGLREVEDGGAADVINAALALQADFRETDSGGFDTVRAFGPVTYKIFALSAASIARYRADASYRGCVTPADA